MSIVRAVTVAAVAAVSLAGVAAGTAQADGLGSSSGASASVSNYAYQDSSLDVQGNGQADGTRVGTYGTNFSPAQSVSWYGFDGDTFAILPGTSGKVLDLDVASGTVQIWDAGQGTDFNAADGGALPANQRWHKYYSNNGWSLLQNVATGQCLKSNGPGVYLSMAACNTGDLSQVWHF
ncbi:RICIN domain-containing protein [Kitasatospora sp. LaBMicrA B282]|uniref:RICIN domain-containing protein n=1 Tax=Kitasatospora sp. LaBMicrA B282 TaxID=3420949 RepID=UPI003D0B9308